MKFRPHQLESVERAVAAMEGGGGFCIFTEQRTGKTAIAVEIARQLAPKALWVICPKVAIPVWKKALKGRRIPVEVVNYEAVVARRREWYERARATPDLMIVADESHFLKTRGSSRSRVVRHLGRSAKYRLALTGTPLGQGLQDAWAQFDFIDPSIFGPYDDQVERSAHSKKIIREGFDSTYIKWGGFKNHQIVGYRNERKFYRKFHAHSYRVTLQEARKLAGYVPFKLRFTRVYFDLTPRTQRIYDELELKLKAVVNQRKIKAKNVLSCIAKLQQITGGFIINATEDGKEIIRIGFEKMEKFHQVVKTLPPKSKFVVMARYIHEIEAITANLRSWGYRVKQVRGGIPYDGKFSEDAIVMQIQSGMAVDMSQASTIIFYSTDYSYFNYEQSRFRTLSFDTATARYFSLLGRNTVDEVIYQAVTRKKNLAKLVCDTYRER